MRINFLQLNQKSDFMTQILKHQLLFASKRLQPKYGEPLPILN
jgi:hypothetical protein